MTGRKVAMSQKMTIAEFERRIPQNAELRRMRIDEHKVSFALGYDSTGTMAIMWNHKGKAFVRPMTRHATERIEFKTGTATRFNGYIYYRCRAFDLAGNNNEP